MPVLKPGILPQSDMEQAAGNAPWDTSDKLTKETWHLAHAHQPSLQHKNARVHRLRQVRQKDQANTPCACLRHICACWCIYPLALLSRLTRCTAQNGGSAASCSRVLQAPTNQAFMITLHCEHCFEPVQPRCMFEKATAAVLNRETTLCSLLVCMVGAEPGARKKHQMRCQSRLLKHVAFACYKALGHHSDHSCWDW